MIWVIFSFAKLDLKCKIEILTDKGLCGSYPRKRNADKLAEAAPSPWKKPDRHKRGISETLSWKKTNPWLIFYLIKCFKS